MTSSRLGNTPIYVAISQQLKSDIAAGRYPPGTLLPPEPILMNQFHASRTSIRHAISILKEEGLVTVRQGYGTEVTNTRPHEYSTIYSTTKFRNIVDIRAQTRNPGQLRTQNGVVDLIRAGETQARMLALTPGSDVYRIRRVKLVDGKPFGYLVSYIPYSVAPGLEELSGNIVTLYTSLKEHYGIVVSEAEEHITACLAESTVSLLLNVPLQSPLLKLYREGRFREQIVEYTESYYAPEQYEIMIRMKGGLDYSNNEILSPEAQ